MVGQKASGAQAVSGDAVLDEVPAAPSSEPAGADLAADLKTVAGDLKSAAVEQGRAIYETARDQATGFADQRKNEAAQSVADIAASLRETGRSFAERPNIQAFVGSAADGLDQLAGSIRDRSFADLYTEVESYARRAPVTVGVAAALAGFALARFIKSSSDELSASAAAAREEAASAPVAKATRKPRAVRGADASDA